VKTPFAPSHRPPGGEAAAPANSTLADAAAGSCSTDCNQSANTTAEPRDDHSSYLASWLDVLKNDNRAIFTAAAHAQRAADYLHELQATAGSNRRRVTRRQARRHPSAAGLFFRGRQIRAARQLPGGAVA
jgi:antirestriction protein ArdC